MLWLIRCSNYKCNLPGLVKECKKLIDEYGLPNIFDEKIKIKHEGWKKVVKDAVQSENENRLNSKMERSNKPKNSKLLEEFWGVKDYVRYLNVHDARTLFKHRCKMTRYFKMNYKGDPRYEKQLWKCEQCFQMDSEKHVLFCSGFAHLRQNKDLNCDKDLVKYLSEVYKIRAKKESKRNTAVS